MTRVVAASLALLAIACARSGPPAPNRFSDPVLIHIYDLADRRATDSLLIYLDDPSPTYRGAAALTFASVQDSAAAEALGALMLNDPDPQVRRYAAFAMGQCRGSAPPSFILMALNREKSDTVLRELLEAAGKQVPASGFQQFLAFSPAGDLQVEGHAWGLYRIGLRGLADSSVVKAAGRYLDASYTVNARLAAAHFFARTRNIRVERESVALKNSALHDADAEVRMAAVLSLRKLPFETVEGVLDSILSAEPDPRVRVSAIRAAASGEFTVSRRIFDRALKDADLSVQITASEIIRSARSEPGFFDLDSLLGGSFNYRVRANLVAAYLKQGSQLKGDHWKSSDRIVQVIRQSNHPYEQAAFLSALGEEPRTYSSLIPFLESDLPVLRTSAMNALAAVNRHPAFNMAWTADFIAFYRKAVLGQDPFVCGIAASALQDPELNYKTLIKDYSFLKEALAKLSLPRDIEAVEPLQSAIAYFEGRSIPDKTESLFNHPIDWDLVKRLPADLTAVIRTTQGDLTIQLLINEAPGSVANFVKLAEQGYYDGLYFHRVVPNFVVQAGCKRGDGYGSEDYSIRSDLGIRRYHTGSVGMASAGKDTEGTQWFITHSPTPHLDGAYSIFALTVSGQDVADRIEVGDKIIAVTFGEK